MCFAASGSVQQQNAKRADMQDASCKGNLWAAAVLACNHRSMQGFSTEVQHSTMEAANIYAASSYVLRFPPGSRVAWLSLGYLLHNALILEFEHNQLRTVYLQEGVYGWLRTRVTGSLCHQVPCVVIKYQESAGPEHCPGLAGIAKDCRRFMATINVNDIEPV